MDNTLFITLNETAATMVAYFIYAQLGLGGIGKFLSMIANNFDNST